MVYRIMFALGIGFTAYSGFDALIATLDSQLRGSFGGLPEFALITAKILKLDVAASILLSAYAIKAGMMATRVALRSI